MYKRGIMQALSYTAARGNLARTMQNVCDDHAPIIITRQNKDAVVMLSLKDYESLAETNYLLQNPKNAKHLLDSMEELENGGGTERKLKG